jgi:hypothetical protein
MLFFGGLGGLAVSYSTAIAVIFFRGLSLF